MSKAKSKALTGVFKKLSIKDLETLNAADGENLKSAVDEVLLAKKILRKVKEKYDSL